FFTWGIALGDTVSTNKDYLIKELLLKGPHTTTRVGIVTQSKEIDDEVHIKLHDFLEQRELRYEWYHSTWVAIDTSDDVETSDLIRFLDVVVGEYGYGLCEVDD